MRTGIYVDSPLSKKCKELQPLSRPPMLHQDENSDSCSDGVWMRICVWNGYRISYVHNLNTRMAYENY
ncbi:hypothetical protein ACSBR2_012310 [Camellia fascicularis]